MHSLNELFVLAAGGALGGLIYWAAQNHGEIFIRAKSRRRR